MCFFFFCNFQTAFNNYVLLLSPILVDVTVASVANQIFVRVRLDRVVHGRTVVTNVTQTVAVRVFLVGIRFFYTIVLGVQHACTTLRK